MSRQPREARGRRKEMLNEKGQRELAYIVKIDGILPKVATYHNPS